MQKIQPDKHDLRIYQKVGRLDAKSLDSVDQLLLILPAKPSKADFGKLPQGAKMQAVYRKHVAGASPAFTTRLANKKQTLVVAGTIAASRKHVRTTDARAQTRCGGHRAKSRQPGDLRSGIRAQTQGELMNNVLAAALAAAFRLPAFKSKAEPSTIKKHPPAGDRQIDRHGAHRSRGQGQ